MKQVETEADKPDGPEGEEIHYPVQQGFVGQNNQQYENAGAETKRARVVEGIKMPD